MSNGVEYWLKVLASNTVTDVVGSGDGALSAAVGSVTVGGIPSAPTATGATSEDRQVTVAWTAPQNTGGGAIQYYTVYTDPPPQSTCGDAGDAATCSALTGATACDAQSKCVWDTSVSDYAHCAVTCTVSVAAIMPATNMLTGAQDLTEAVVEANTKFKVGVVTAALFEADDMVVVSQKSDQAQCECVGMYNCLLYTSPSPRD